MHPGQSWAMHAELAGSTQERLEELCKLHSVQQPAADAQLPTGGSQAIVIAREETQN